MIQLAEATLFSIVLIYVGFTIGAWFTRGRRRPSVAKIIALRQALAAATPPQFAAQMPAADFHALLENQLRTYLEFGGDLTPPPSFARATAPRQGDLSGDTAAMESAGRASYSR
jgi:hypothetical protein